MKEEKNIDDKTTFIKDIVYYLNMMDESLDITKLSKLFSSINYCKIDAEFTEDEVETFNAYIKNNDYSNIIEFFARKINMSIDVLDDMIISIYNNILDFITSEVYTNYGCVVSRTEFLNQLTYYERIAVMFDNFDKQVMAGGLYQWHKNGYSEDYETMYEFIKNSNFVEKTKFLNILDNFSNVMKAIDKLNQDDVWYNEDYKTRINALNIYDNDYYSIEDDLIGSLNNYLMSNIPDKYVKKIIDLNNDKKIQEV